MEDLSLFVFGVGYDVDTYLLDSLTQNHHGKSTYVVPGEELDETISAFYNKISTPVMTNLDIDFGNLITRDVFPDPLPDLFQGSQIAVVGRYEDGGLRDVVLTGTVNGVATKLIYKDKDFLERNRIARESLASIPSLWATRKIGYLLQQIRLHGPDDEIIEDVVEISIRYGIVTPYTSYLVTEPSMLGAEDQARIVSEEIQRFNDLATLPTFGQGAVEQAEGQNSLASADAAPQEPREAQGKFKTIGSETFILDDGVWIDTRYDPNVSQTIKIQFLSNEYFSLSRENSQLANTFALGPRVIVMEAGTFYEIVDDDSPAPDHIEIIPSPTPSIDDQNEADGISKTEPSPTVTTFPCWGGLVITMVPMILAGIVNIRSYNEKCE